MTWSGLDCDRWLWLYIILRINVTSKETRWQRGMHHLKLKMTSHTSTTSYDEKVTLIKTLRKWTPAKDGYQLHRQGQVTIFCLRAWHLNNRNADTHASSPHHHNAHVILYNKVLYIPVIIHRCRMLEPNRKGMWPVYMSYRENCTTP